MGRNHRMGYDGRPSCLDTSGLCRNDTDGDDNCSWCKDWTISQRKEDCDARRMGEALGKLFDRDRPRAMDLLVMAGVNHRQLDDLIMSVERNRVHLPPSADDFIDVTFHA